MSPLIPGGSPRRVVNMAKAKSGQIMMRQVRDYIAPLLLSSAVLNLESRCVKLHGQSFYHEPPGSAYYNLLALHHQPGQPDDVCLAEFGKEKLPVSYITVAFPPPTVKPGGAMPFLLIYAYPDR